jgi:hypothetical protein
LNRRLLKSHSYFGKKKRHQGGSLEEVEMAAFKRNHAKTFNGIFGAVAAKNAQRLMERAQTANRLAKSLRGRSRRRAYAIKTETLIGLVRAFPEQTTVVIDSRTPNYVLIKNAQAGFGLHGPEQTFVPSVPARLSNESWPNQSDRQAA